MHAARATHSPPVGADGHAPLSHASLAVVQLQLGAVRIAVEAACVQSLAPCADDAPWPTLEAVLGLPTPAPLGPRRCLSLRLLPGSTPPLQLSVPATLSLQHLPAPSIWPIPPLLAACCRLPGLRALSWQPQGVVLLVDVRRLGGADPRR